MKKHKIAIIFSGDPALRGRQLKQLKTFQDAGNQCFLINAHQKGAGAPPSNVPTRSLLINLKRGPLWSITSQMYFCWWSYRQIRDIRPDALICVGVENVLSGIFSKLSGIPVRLIFDNKELYLESHHNPLKRCFWRIIQSWALKTFDVVIHAEKNRMDYFLNKYRCPPAQRHVVIENFPFRAYLPVRRMKNAGSEVRVVFLGLIAPERQCVEVAECFKNLPDRYCLDFVGHGPVGYREMLKTTVTGCSKIRLLPPVPHAEVPKLLQQYDVGLMFYWNKNLNCYYCAPNKLYDYLAAGLPVIGNRYPGVIDVLEANRVGVCIDEINTQSLRAACDGIVERHLAENITQKLIDRYTWEQQEKTLLSLLETRTLNAGI